MSARLKALLEQRGGAWEQAKTVLAEAGDQPMNSEQLERYERADTEIDTLTKQIELEQRHAGRAPELDKIDEPPVRTLPPGDDGEERDGGAESAYERAWQGYLRDGTAGLEPDQRQVLRSRFTDAKELRAQGVSTGGAGGYFVPQGFRDRIIERMKYFRPVQDVAEVIQTDTGNPFPWPTNDDTSNVGAILSENTQVTEQDVTIGQAQLGAYMYTSKLVRVSFQLLQDSAFDLEAFLERKFAQRLGRATNAHFTTGTGSGQPQGIVTGTTQTVTGSATTSVTPDELIDLEHKIDAAYRNNNARFMLHDLTLAKIRKLKDADDRPLWQPTMQAGVPDNINGRPYVVNNDMPAMAASAKSVLFGDFQAAYVIRIVRGMQSLRLEERYADYLQTGFLAFERVDGMVQDAHAVAALVNAAS